MKEVKFRVWDEKIGSFDYDSLVAYKGYDISRYTGFKDKDGTMIYEGDIIKYQAYCNWGYESDFSIGEVKWGIVYDSDNYLHNEIHTWEVNLDSLTDIVNGDCKVIGNIHENPELLD